MSAPSCVSALELPVAIIGGLAGWWEGCADTVIVDWRDSSPTRSFTRTVRLPPPESIRLRRPGLVLSLVMSAPIPEMLAMSVSM